MKENKTLRLLSKAYNRDRNRIKVSKCVTFTHEVIKSIIAILLIKRGHEIITEAIFENGGRADVLDLSTGIVYEVLHTEKIEEFNKKLYKYPLELSIIPIYTLEFEEKDLNSIKENLNKKLI